jgi:signal transduction histidine kinase
LATKLASVTFVLALVPLVLVALVNAREVESQSVARERDALERRAASAARRVEERVARLRAYVEVLTTNPALAQAVGDAAPAEEWAARHPEVEDLIISIRKGNPWFQNVYLLDARGVCIATSERDEKPDMIGRSYDYRPYFRQPRASKEPFVSDVLKNANSPGTAIFVSAPLLVDGDVAAVGVIKIDTAALHAVVAELAALGGRALMVDRFGVVVSDATPEGSRLLDDPRSLQFHPLADVQRWLAQFEETKRYGEAEGENYFARIKQPLGLEPLWRALQGGDTGAHEYDVPPAPGEAGRPTMLGYGPVWSAEEQPYGYVVIGEPSSEFREPLERLTRASLLRIVLTFAGVAVVIAVSLRGLSRRMGQLTAATQRVADGERGIVLPTTPADELGALAASFNRMSERLATTADTLRAERDRAQAAREEAQRQAALRDAVLVRVGGRTLAGASRWESAIEGWRESLEPPDGLHEAAATAAGMRAQGETALAFSEGGLPEPNLEPVELTRLLRAAIEAAKPAAALSETTLHLEVENALGRITTDAARLRAVIDELLANAIRSTRHGSVTLHVVRRDTTSPPRVELSITDTGVGMTKGQRQQLHRPEPRSDGGGLGLHMAGRLAASIGAQIEIDGIPGEGTTVRVDLSC